MHVYSIPCPILSQYHTHQHTHIPSSPTPPFPVPPPSTTPVTNNIKPPLPLLNLNLPLLQLNNLRISRPLVNILQQLPDIFFLPLPFPRYFAVGCVSHEAGEVVGGGVFLGEVAEKYALDLAVDEEGDLWGRGVSWD